MRPPCEQYVPGYGDANAAFHVVGDHPGVHGGASRPDGGTTTAETAPTDEDDGTGLDGSGVPFTNDAGVRLQRALVEAGLLDEAGPRPTVRGTFLSYLHMCVPDGTPTEREYAEMERYFDAELRAIAAHVLLPVGERATRHVLSEYTAQAAKTDDDVAALHGTEIRGSGFLVYPVRDPSEWDDGDEERLVQALRALQSTDFRREVDLGRFLPGEDTWRVR
ncbi:uracil-DNA glycosylase [Halomarina oriensis]|uniref:Uracil-DNA glycosylase n=2 Tax=Halomarina oriensis TaxID=671145 RepID=A0A6B0GQ80_9EURY|nr:uracil-DNA glycosylase family protein [Halomarina oriensis]MWG35749.1 uracil-DNA glycosylase [Halomarina oriensis]